MICKTEEKVLTLDIFCSKKGDACLRGTRLFRFVGRRDLFYRTI